MNESGPNSRESIIEQPLLSFVKILGEGSYGNVRLYLDAKKSFLPIAVKCIDNSDDPEHNRRLANEVLIQRKFNGQDRIVNCYGCANDILETKIFLEFLDGGELFDRIEPDYGISEELSRHYLKHLMEGLKVIHEKGIAHRDIKPENLLLSWKNNLKIADFGLATVYKGGGKERMLHTGCGSEHYTSPQIQTRSYRGEPNDIWACGIVLFVMLTGAFPWENVMRDYARWLTGDASNEPPWSTFGAEVKDLLTAMLCFNENRRTRISDVQNHIWYKMMPKHSEDLKRKAANTKSVESKDKKDTNSSGMVSQPPGSTESLTIDRRRGTLHPIKKYSFSQPSNAVSEAIFTRLSQLDSQQSQNINPSSLFVRRSTRIFVSATTSNAVDTVLEACMIHNYVCLSRCDAELRVSISRETSFVVAFVEVPEIEMSLLLLDFRRSHGDGLEFKRAFAKIKQHLNSIVCEQNAEWLETVKSLAACLL